MPNFEINILKNRFKATTLTNRNGEEISNGSTNNHVHTIQKKYNLSKSTKFTQKKHIAYRLTCDGLKYVDFM